MSDIDNPDLEYPITESTAIAARYRLQAMDQFTERSACEIGYFSIDILNGQHDGKVANADVIRAAASSRDIFGDLFHEERKRCHEIIGQYYGNMEKRHERIELENRGLGAI